MINDNYRYMHRYDYGIEGSCASEATVPGIGQNTLDGDRSWQCAKITDAAVNVVINGLRQGFREIDGFIGGGIRNGKANVVINNSTVMNNFSSKVRRWHLQLWRECDIKPWSLAIMLRDFWVVASKTMVVAQWC